MNKRDYIIYTIEKLVGKFEPFLSTIRRKMSYFGNTCRYNSMTKTILPEKVEGS